MGCILAFTTGWVDAPHNAAPLGWLPAVTGQIFDPHCAFLHSLQPNSYTSCHSVDLFLLQGSCMVGCNASYSAQGGLTHLVRTASWVAVVRQVLGSLQGGCTHLIPQRHRVSLLLHRGGCQVLDPRLRPRLPSLLQHCDLAGRQPPRPQPVLPPNCTTSPIQTMHSFLPHFLSNRLILTVCRVPHTMFPGR